eukprot:s1031_g23.t1
MSAGWNICAEDRSLKNGNYEIPIEFQNKGLVVKGHVRMVGTMPCSIRALKAEPTPGLQGYIDNAFGWNKERDRWVGIHLSTQCQNPLFVPNIDYTIEWHRTTLIKKDQSWVMVEFCEKVSEMIEANRFIEETAGRTTVVTFLIDGFEDVESMGFEVEGGLNRDQFEALELGSIQCWISLKMWSWSDRSWMKLYSMDLKNQLQEFKKLMIVELFNQ